MATLTTEYVSDNSTMFKRPSNWTEIKEPELFSFEKIGDTLQGTLLDLRTEKISDGQGGAPRDVLTARLELEQGRQVKIRPSFDLRQKLGKRLLGRQVLIVFDSENAATENKGNKLKVFRVFVAPEHDATEPPFVATDDDVPNF